MQKKQGNAKIKVPREIWASITERGQVTVPAEVRKALGLSKPGKVVFQVQDGEVVLEKPRFSSIAEIAGSVPSLKQSKSWEELQETAHDEVARQVANSMRREAGDRR